IAGQFGEPRHQRETLLAQSLELAQSRGVAAPSGLRQVRKRHRIEIVVGERDEAEPATPQLDDFADDAIGRALPRLLTVGPPHGTERAVPGAASQRLY